MPIWFHGTTKKNSDSILVNGFKEGTFFAKHLENAIGFGGEYVFYVWFDDEPTECWEYVAFKPISVDRILGLRNFKLKTLYESKEVAKYIRKYLHKENYSNKIFCEKCCGQGELNDVSWFSLMRDREVVVCPECNGYGYV
jgi:hypothetical protein